MDTEELNLKGPVRQAARKKDNPVRIWIDIRISNGLHLFQRNFNISRYSSYGRKTGGIY